MSKQRLKAQLLCHQAKKQETSKVLRMTCPMCCQVAQGTKASKANVKIDVVSVQKLRHCKYCFTQDSYPALI
jgi:hypothetical protein